MPGTDNVGDAPSRIAGVFEGIKDVMVACSRKQEEQRSAIAELQKAADAQDKKLAVLRQQVRELKARLGSGAAPKLARGKRATALAVSDKRQLRGAAPCTSAPKVPLPTVHEEIDPIGGAKTKKVYSNGKLTFPRELLLKSLDLPPNTIDARMEPCLQELAEELGRPRTKPAPAPTRYSNQGARRQNTQSSSSGRWVSQSGHWNESWKSDSNSHGAWKATNWKPDGQGAWNW